MDGHASAHAGTLAGFGRVWRPGTHPEGMLCAYACSPADGGGNHRVSFWALRELCEAWRSSAAKARRREAMAAYVVRGAGAVLLRPRVAYVPGR